MNEKFLEQFKIATKEEVVKLNYKKYFYQYTEEEKEAMVKDLKSIEIFFKEELEIDVYPIYGTLLGMVRDNDFIGWDTDIDIAYLSKCKTHKAILNEFNMICGFLYKKGLLLKRILTASHAHIYSPNKKLRVDLWISWIDEKDNYHIVWTVDGDLPKEMILPFKEIEFKGEKFKLINNAKLFLDEHYPNWEKEYIPGTQEVWAKRKPRFELEPWRNE